MYNMTLEFSGGSLMKKINSLFLSLVISVIPLFFMSGCGSGSAENIESSVNASVPNAPLLTASIPLEIIDDEGFNALSEDDKVYVANKLYTTFFKGKDLASIKREIATGRFISDFRDRLYATDVDQPDLDKILPDDYQIIDGRRFGDPLLEKFKSIYSHIISALYYKKLSKDYYDEWMAYILGQTILFSPAWEVESVHPFPELITSNYNRLKTMIAQNRSVKEIAYTHMISKENWSRFRSPEDNGREMLEIWLYDFNDLHVPLAAKALINWRWVVSYGPVSDTANDYYYTFHNDSTNPDEKNSEPIEFLGTTVTTGEDFYHAVVEHEDFMGGVVQRIVNIFFATFSEDRRRSIVETVLDTDPKTFRDIFDKIIFSKEYLLESDKVKSYEEIYMSLAHKLDIDPGAALFDRLHQPGSQVYEGGLAVSKQWAFTYKLGRSDMVPSDSDSIMRLHLNIRDAVFLNRRGNKGWNYTNLLSRYDTSSPENYLNSMFLDIVGRKMSEDEKITLLRIAGNAGCITTTGFDKFTMMLMTFDYFSRLSEIYIYRKVQTQGDAS